ncbi:hypothetical protein ACN6MY_14725 [Peribacillus sp. B-H-3]|uniref:hypothetical protein n=1 Tax=Peribacillus sp. B-H-3 TaxID=3400420 RepID=UPI003B02CE32
MDIKFNGFTIKIKDFVEMEMHPGIVFVSDCEIKSDEFDSFKRYYWEHNKKGNYFNTTFNNKGFYGRFGQILYAKNGEIYNLRLTFVELEVDIEEDNHPELVTFDARYQNLIQKTINQDVIIQRLTRILKDKGILSPEQVKGILEVNKEDKWEKEIQLASEVSDLSVYLKENEETLYDLRNQIENF